MSEKILVTGGTGFVGSHMLDFIIENHPNTEVFATKRWHLSPMHNVQHLQGKISWIDTDLTDPISTRTAIEKVSPDRIFHFASESFVSPSWENPNRYMTVNYNGTLNILEALRQTQSQARLLIPGSGEEYGEIDESELPITPSTVLRPVNPYAVTKVAQDLIGYVYYKSYGINVIRTRAFNHEGPRRDKVFGIPWYAYQIACVEAGRQAPLLKVGHIDDLRNFTHVKDMVRAYWLASEKLPVGDLFLIGSEKKESVSTFRQALETLISRSTVEGIKYEIDPQYVRPTQVPLLIADVKPFRELTGWEPELSLEDILTDTLVFWRDRVEKGIV